MRRRTFFSLPAAAALATTTSSAALPEDVLLRAMRDEMKRSLKKLQLENLEKPYFLSYRVVETNTVSAIGSFGALQSSNEERRRLLSTECRVGSHEFDNTNFYSMRTAMSGVVRVQADFGASLPLDDDYDEIRRQLWLFTDSAYKQSLDDLAKKRAALENRTRTGAAIADFSKEERVEDAERRGRFGWTLAQVQKLARDLSLEFRKSKGIDNSGVRVEVVDTLTRFVSSEGTEYWREAPLLFLQFFADGQASDGMPVADVESIYYGDPANLPTPAALLDRLRAFEKRLRNLIAANVLQRYAGPVLFEEAAAAELFSQGFASSLLGVPRLVVDDPRFDGIFAADQGTLLDKLSTRVLPSHCSVTDDPTLKSGLGSRQVDEEGVRTKSVNVVENGILKRVLHTRSLIAGATQSTGSRRAAGVAPSNIVVQSTKGVPLTELRQQLLALIKDRNLEFGMIIRKLANPSDQFARPRSRVMIISRGGAQGVTLSPVVEAVKVFPDGREELVRNLEIQGFALASFRDIVGVSRETFEHTVSFRNPRMSPLMGGILMTARVPVTLRVPALLFEDITLQVPAGEVPKLPITPHPSFG
jgi:hypothetical protein